MANKKYNVVIDAEKIQETSDFQSHADENDGGIF